MRKRYPNVEHLVAELPEGSFARTLCECFVEVESSDEAERKVRAILDQRLLELLHATPEDEGS